MFPKRDTPSLYERRVAVVGTAHDGKAVRVRDAYVVHDLATRQETYEYIYQAEVDPHTGVNLNVESRGDLVRFSPRCPAARIFPA